MVKLVIPALFMTALLVWGPGIHYGHTYTFVIMALVMMSIMLSNPVITAFGIYLACWFTFLLSAGFNGVIPVEIVVQGIDTILMILAGMTVYLSVKTSTGKKDRYLNGICTLSMVLFIVGIVQYFIDGNFSATMGNRNFLSAFLAISLPMFFRPGWKKFIPFIIIGLGLSQTSTAIAAALIGTGWYFCGWKGAGLAVLPGCLYYLLFKLNVHALSLGTRLDYWSDAIHKISNSWITMLFGVGPGVYWQFQNDLHSEYMNALFNLGILGLALIILYIVKSSRRQSDKILFASFIVICLNAVGNHLMHTAPTAMLALIVFALRDRQEVTANG